MTREEAIAWIKEHHDTQMEKCKDSEAMRMAISALEQQQKDEDLAAEIAKNVLKIKEPCGMISRDVAKAEYRKRFINNLKDDKRNIDLSKYAEEPCKKFDEFIDSLPSVQTIECKDTISREDANELAQELVYTTSDKTDYITNLFEGLSKLPPVQPIREIKPKEEMTVEETISDLIWLLGSNLLDKGSEDTVLNAIYHLENQPFRKGHWILTSDDDYEYCTCSECGYQNGENWMIGSQIKFCQECGAKMVESQESEDKTEEAIKQDEYDKAYDDYLALVNADINPKVVEPQESEE